MARAAAYRLLRVLRVVLLGELLGEVRVLQVVLGGHLRVLADRCMRIVLRNLPVGLVRRQLSVLRVLWKLRELSVLLERRAVLRLR